MPNNEEAASILQTDARPKYDAPHSPKASETPPRCPELSASQTAVALSSRQLVAIMKTDGGHYEEVHNETGLGGGDYEGVHNEACLNSKTKVAIMKGFIMRPVWDNKSRWRL